MDLKTKAAAMREAMEQTAKSLEDEGRLLEAVRVSAGMADLQDDVAARLLEFCVATFCEKNKRPNELLDDLSQHLAHHASIGFAAFRRREHPQVVPKPEWTGRTDDMDREFTVTHQDRQFCITVEEIDG